MKNPEEKPCRYYHFLLKSCTVSLSAVLLLLSFIIPAFSQFEGNTSVEFERIKIQLPGSWHLERDGKTLIASLNGVANTSIIFVDPVIRDRQSIQDYLRQGVAGFEKGRRLLQAFPRSPESGLTKSGVGFSFWGLRTRGSDSKERFAMYYAFSAASMYQTMIVLTDKNTVFASLAKVLSPAIDVMELSLPPAEVRPLQGIQESFFNYSMQIPVTWKYEPGPVASVRVFSFDREKAGIRTGTGSSVKCTMELQPGVPQSPVLALAAFLEDRASIYTKNNKYTKFRIKKITDGRLQNGQAYVAMMLESIISPKDSYPELDIMGGILIQGPGSSMMLGAGHHVETYSYKYKRDDMARDLGIFEGLYFDTLPSIAGTVRWATSGLKRNPGYEKWLKNKKSFRYISSGSASTMDARITVLMSRRSNWKFYTDGTAEYDYEKITSATTVDYGPYNVPRYSSGYTSGQTTGKRALFEVWDQGGKSHLILRYPSGLGTVHRVSFSPFEIDGLRDGCCK